MMGMKQNVNHSLRDVSLQTGQAGGLGCRMLRSYMSSLDVPSLHHPSGKVAAVLALHGDVLGAAELRVERW